MLQLMPNKVKKMKFFLFTLFVCSVSIGFSQSLGFSFAPSTTNDTLYIGQGSSVLFTTSSTSGAVSWLFPGTTTLSSTSSAPVLVRYNSVGTFTVTHTKNGVTTTYVVNVSPSTPSNLPQMTDANFGSSLLGGVAYLTYCSTSGDEGALFEFQTNTSNTSPTTEHTFSWGDGSPPETQLGVNLLASNAGSHFYSSSGLFYCIYSVKNPDQNFVVSSAYRIYIGSSPSASISILGTPQYCNPGSINYSINPAPQNSPGTSYTVSVTGSTPVVFNHPPPASYLHSFSSTSCGFTSIINSINYPQSFQATIISANACGSTSNTYGPINVQRAPKSYMTVSPNPASNNNKICQGSNLSFTDSSTAGQNIIQGQVVGSTAKISCNTTYKKYWKIFGPNGALQTASNGIISPNPYVSVVGTLGYANVPNSSSSWSSNSSPTINVQFNLPGQYTIRFYTGSNSCGIDSSERVICVVPSFVASISSPVTEVCAPYVLNLQNSTPTTSCAPPYTSAWTVSSSNSQSCGTSAWAYASGTSASSANPSLSLTGPGSYTVNLTNSYSVPIFNNSSPLGCQAQSASVVIKVKDKPVLNVTAAAAVCQDATFSPVANFNSCYSTSAPSVSWSFGNGNSASLSTSTSLTPSLSYSAGGSYSYTVTATNDCGSSSMDKTIIVSPKVAVTVAAPSSVCVNSPISLTATTTGGSVASINWWTGVVGGSFSSPSGNTTTYTTPANYTGNVTFTATAVPPPGGACPNSTGALLTVVNPKAVASGGANIAVCGDSPVPLTGSFSGAATSASWITSGTGTFANSGSMSTSYTPSVQDKTSGNVILTLVTNDPVGPCPRDSDQVILTINSTPAISAGNDQTVCQLTPVSLNATISGGTSAMGVTWTSLNGGSFSSSTSLTPTWTPSTSFTGVANLVATTTGMAPCPVSRDTVAVNVFATPVVSNMTQTLCSGGNFTVVPTNSTLPTGTTYTWTVASNASVDGEEANAVPQTSITGSLVNTTSTVQTVVYTVTPKSSSPSNCEGTPFTLTVTVNPTAKISNQTLASCSGTSVSVTPVDGVGGDLVPSGTKYTWTTPSIIPFGSVTGSTGQSTTQSSFSQFLTATSNTSSTVAYTVTPVSGSCNGTPFSVQVTLNPKPIIPDQTATICSGQAFTISPTSTVVPSGTTYTWTVTSNFNVTGETTVTTAQNTVTQTLTNVTNQQQIVNYTVTPKSGSCAGNTFAANVTLNPILTLSNVQTTVCSGTSFTINPGTIGGNSAPTGTTYTWVAQPNTNVSGQTNQSVGQTTINQTLTNSTSSQQTVVYTVIPTSNSCEGVPFTFKVNLSLKPSIPNQTAVVCSGSSFVVSPVNNPPSSVVPTGTLYSWTAPQSSPSGAVTGGVSKTNSTTIGQSLSNTTSSPAVATYTVTPSIGVCVGDPFTVQVTVNNLPVVSNQSRTICSGQSFNVASSSVPAGTTYTWTVYSTPSVAGENGMSVPKSSVSDTLVNLTNTAQAVTYVAVPKTPSPTSCAGPQFTITVTVNPSPIVADQPINVCSGSPATFVPANGGTNVVPSGSKYSWTSPTVTPSGALTGSLLQASQVSTFSQTLTNVTSAPASALYTVTPYTGICAGLPFTITVNVNPKPVIENQTATICSSGTFNTTPADGAGNIVPTGTTYTWTVVDNTSVTGESSISTPQTAISQSLVNTSNQVQTVVYTVTPSMNGAVNCLGTPFTVTVTVNPKPVISTTQLTICSGTNFSIAPANGNGNIVPSNTTYTWTVQDNTNVTGYSNQSGAQTSIAQFLTNNSSSQQTVVYTVTPVSGACIGDVFEAQVTVTLKPVLPDQSATICSGTSFNISPVNNLPSTVVPPGTVYSWTTPQSIPVNVVTGGLAQNNQSSISQVLSNATNGVAVLRYTVTPSIGICIGNSFTVDVTVNNLPLINNQVQTICSGDAFTLAPTNSSVPTGTTYSWTVSSNASVTGASESTGNQAAISDTLLNTSNAVQVVTYTVVPKLPSPTFCEGPSFTISVTVNPRPQVEDQEVTVCSDVPVTLSLTPGSNTIPSGTKYSWTAPVSTPLNALTGGAAQSNPQTAFSQVLTNVTPSSATVSYKVIPISGSCVGDTFTVVATINPKPFAANQSVTICSGETFTVSPSDGGGNSVPSGTKYTWTVANNLNVSGESQVTTPQVSVSQLLTNTTNQQQTVVYTVTPISGASGNCSGSTFTVTVTVNAKPVVSNVQTTICSGSTFSTTPVNGSGGNIIPPGTTYTWTVGANSNVTGFSDQSTGQSAISQTLSNTSNQPQVLNYSVTPIVGTCNGSPFSVQVTVNLKPVIPNQLTTICSGQPFTVLPTNAPPTTVVPTGTAYTWAAPQNTSTATITGGSAKTAQSIISQTLVNTSNTVGTMQYTVVPSLGTCIGTSFTVNVTVNNLPVISNQTQTICSGAGFSVAPFSASVPAGTTFTWTVASNPNVDGESGRITGTSAITDTLVNNTNAQQTVIYTVTPTSPSPANCNGSAFTLTVKVDPKPLVATQNNVICSGGTAVVDPLNGADGNIIPTGTKYTWTNTSISPAGSLIGVSGQSTPQTTMSQTLTDLTNTTSTATYKLVPISGVCQGDSFNVQIVVNPKPFVADTAIIICSGESFTIQPINGNGNVIPSGTSYTWTVQATSSISGETSNTIPKNVLSQALDNTTNQTQILVYKVVPVSPNNCSGNFFLVTVTVQPKPQVTNTEVKVCSGTTFSVSPVNIVGTSIVPNGTMYSWTVDPNANITGASNQSAPQTVISQTLLNETYETQSAFYNVTPVTGTCVGAPFIVEVKLLIKPVIEDFSLTVCSGQTFVVEPVDGPPTSIVPQGIIYSWTAPQATSGVISSGGSAQSYKPFISQTLQNTSSAISVMRYQVIPINSACLGNKFFIDVTVNPLPTTGNMVESICSGESFNFTPLNPTMPAGTTFTWTVSNSQFVGGESANSISSPSVFDTLVNFTNVLHEVVYTVTPKSPSPFNCVGTPFTITVKVKPAPSIQEYVLEVASGCAFKVSPVNSLPQFIVPSGTTYSWSLPITTGTVTNAFAGTNQAYIQDTLINGTNIIQTAVYTVTPTSGAPFSCAGKPFTINVNIEPQTTIPNQQITICSGETFTYDPTLDTLVSIVPVGTTYSWSMPQSTANIGGMAAGSGESVLTATLTNLAATPQTVVYKLKPSSSGIPSCIEQDFTVTVIVNPRPVVQNEYAVVCSGSTFNNAPGNSTAGNTIPTSTIYRWDAPAAQAGVSGITDGVDKLSISQTLTNSTNQTKSLVYNILPVVATSGCKGNKFDLFVTLRAIPIISDTVLTMCSTQPINLNLAANPSNIVPADVIYSWPLPTITSGLIGATQGTNKIDFSQTLVNATLQPQLANYIVTPKNNGCNGAPFQVNATVYPRPSLENVQVDVCSNEELILNLNLDQNSTVPPNTTYSWGLPVAAASITGYTIGSDALNFKQLLVNSLTNSALATYKLVARAGSCMSDTFEVKVTVNSVPVVYAGADFTSCEGIPIILSGTGAPVNTWSNGVVNNVGFVPPVGTTTYLLTGTTSEGCSSTDQITVVIEPLPSADFTVSDSLGCSPFETSLINLNQNASNCTWTISDGTELTGNGFVPYTFNKSGCFDITLKVVSTAGCVNSKTIPSVVCVHPKPEASFTPSATIITEDSPTVNFTNTSSGATNYTWNFGDKHPPSTELHAIHTFSVYDVTSYITSLVVENEFGCLDTAYASFEVKDPVIYYVPNSFTPDGNTLNQVFKPIITSGIDPYDYEMKIFNRWGEVMFESHNPAVGWEGTYGEGGKVVQDGVYSWKISYRKTYSAEKVVIAGNLNLLK